MAHNQPIRKITRGSGAQSSEIPDKLYFRIGEVARLCKVPAYVLRFWESEFPQLKPNKGGTGQRLYRRRDVEMAMRVKTLLKDEGYTIPGARQVLKTEFKQKGPQLSLLGAEVPGVKQLRALRRELESIATVLSQPIARIAGAAKSSKKLQPQSAKVGHPATPIRASRRSSTRTQPGTDAASPSRPSNRTPSGEFLFDALATGSNSEGDGN
ncbi:MAG: MerR family transcriptional regulator [Acidobacteriaceae bacterium]